ADPPAATGRLGGAFPQCAGVRTARDRPIAGGWHCAHQPRHGPRIPARRPSAMTPDSSRARSLSSLRPQVLEMDLALENPLRVEGPQVILTDFTERIQARERARTATVAPVLAGRRNRTVSFGLAGIGAFVALWFAVDAISWISAAFEHSTSLGVLAAAAVAAG